MQQTRLGFEYEPYPMQGEIISNFLNKVEVIQKSSDEPLDQKKHRNLSQNFLNECTFKLLKS